MANKHLLLSLEDENAKALGEVIANKTSRKIVNFLAEEEASENKIAKALGIPINTVEYNLNKLLKAGLIEKSKKFFWSDRGKKIDVYKVANKIIVISPKKSSLSKVKSFLPVFLVAAVFTVFTWLYNKTNLFVSDAKQVVQEQVFATRDATPSLIGEAGDVAISSAYSFGTLEYFLIAIWAIIIIFFVYTLVKGGPKNNGKIS